MNRLRTIVALIAAIVAIAVAFSLGHWQLRRAEEKLALQASWDRAAQQAPIEVTASAVGAIGANLPRSVRLSGRFVHEHEIWLENRRMDGRAGFFLITPLRLADGAIVPVNRGFAPRDPLDRTRLPEIGRPQATVVIEGLAVEQPPRVLQLGDASASASGGPIWQNFNFAEFERASGMRAARFVVRQSGGADDGLLRNWPPISVGVDTHRGYAIQWFALAALIAFLTLFFGYRKLRARKAEAELEHV